MKALKRYFKRNTHNLFFKGLAGFGRSLNRLYENRNHDIHSNGELSVIKKISKIKPKVIIDGGANIGGYSMFINKYIPSCKVYSFEPVESTYNKLLKKVKSHDNITPINKGLFSNNCSKEINLFDSNTHSSLYDIKGVSYQSSNKSTIELIRGDDFIKANNIESIDFMKLDLEGAEFDALIGFQESLKNGIIKAIQFEYGYINISTKKLLIDFYELFNKYGYTLGKIFPKTVEFRDYEFKHEDFIGPNFIAVNKKESKLIEILKKKL